MAKNAAIKTNVHRISGPTYLDIYNNLLEGRSSPKQIAFELDLGFSFPVKITHISASKRPDEIKFKGLILKGGEVIKVKGSYMVRHTLGDVKITREIYDYFVHEEPRLLEDE